MELAIFGAKSIALGCYLAIESLYSEHKVKCFLVSSLENNPEILAGLPVIELKDFNEKQCKIIIATPENVHNEIIKKLKEYGFNDFICLTSEKENSLMKKYYEKIRKFESIEKLNTGNIKSKLRVFAAKSHKDKTIVNTNFPEWVSTLQAGADLTDMKICDNADNVGENISRKNLNYCELTVLYWIWKNCDFKEDDYYGLFHYRRMLDIKQDDILKLKENKVDVILPYPLVCEPDIKEHHLRYIKESDWQAMLQALSELQPKYYEAYEKIFSQKYMYNYNMIIATPKVLNDYCNWLFPILEKTEELSTPKENERCDRYIGYIGESLLTLYFLYNSDKLKIVHTGRKLFL